MSILFLGPLPPPVHGFAQINKLMLEQLSKKTKVHIFDRAPARVTRFKKIITIINWLTNIIKFFIFSITKKPTALYAGISGGKGQILDIPFILISRLFGTPIYLHHHSFAYLNKKSKLAKICFYIANSHHIVLCSDMKEKLKYTYGIIDESITVLSNIVFIPPRQESKATKLLTKDIITIGFLSNITEEKGIFSFFETLQKITDSNFNVKAEIAGPVNAAIINRFNSEISKSKNSIHVGPLYGQEKNNFFDRIDILLFPTKYANEAEPLTILEAMQAGVTVIAAERGCISGMIPNRCGSSTLIENYSTHTINELNKFPYEIEQRTRIRREISSKYIELWNENNINLSKIIDKICPNI